MPAAPHLRVVVATDEPPPRRRFSAWAPFPIAVLVAIAAVAGIFHPAIYARETASWAAQGIGQDWVNLMVVAPALLVLGGLGVRGSRKARVLVGGTLLYTAYSFLIYAVAVHFGALFLVHCAVLGLSSFALVDLIRTCEREDPPPWYDDTAPIRTTAATLFALAALFAALWLSQIVAALVRGGEPAALTEVGLVANPVHVLDLSLVLPLMVVAGIGLVRRTALGQILAPILLSFSALMALAIAGMVVEMNRRGVAHDAGPAVGMILVAAISIGVLTVLLRHMRS